MTNDLDIMCIDYCKDDSSQHLFVELKVTVLDADVNVD